MSTMFLFMFPIVIQSVFGALGSSSDEESDAAIHGSYSEEWYDNANYVDSGSEDSYSAEFIDHKVPVFRTTRKHIMDLKQDIEDLIKSNAVGDSNGDVAPLIARVVRLVFHDCVEDRVDKHGHFVSDAEGNGMTGCDGCLQTHGTHVPNRGIAATINIINDLYDTKYSLYMSRADFWANSATAALEYAALFAAQQENRHATSKDSGFEPSYYYGRVDCSTSPLYVDRFVNNDIGIWHNFPSAHFTGSESMNFFNNKFNGFNNRLSVALMGVHTLGRGRSRWGGQWVVGGEHILNNQYYIDMVDKSGALNWKSVKIGRRGPPTTPVEEHGRRIFIHESEWNNLNAMEGGIDGVLDFSTPEIGTIQSTMFASDMGIYRDFIDTSSPGALVLSCNSDQNPSNELVWTDPDGIPDGFEVNVCDVPHDNVEEGIVSSDDEPDDDALPSQWVEYYANNNDEWLQDFTEAIQITYTHGYTIGGDIFEVEGL